MGIVKRYSALIHLGILESAILVFIVLIWGAALYESIFLSKIQALIYGEEYTIIDVFANGYGVIIGSISAMLLPEYIKNAKSTVSFGGATISPLEISIILVMLFVALFAPYIMLHKCITVLDMAVAAKKMSAMQAALRLDTISYTIGLNIVIDVLLGAWAIYEIESHNNKIKTIEFGKNKKKKNKEEKNDEKIEVREEKKPSKEDDDKSKDEKKEDNKQTKLTLEKK